MFHRLTPYNLLRLLVLGFVFLALIGLLIVFIHNLFNSSIQPLELIKKHSALLITLSAFLILATAAKSFVLLRQGNEAILERLGRYHRSLMRPGLHFTFPFIDRVIPISMKERVTDCYVECLTDDEIPLKVSVRLLLYWRISDLARAYYQVENVTLALESLAQSTVRENISRLTVERLLEEVNVFERTISFEAVIKKLIDISRSLSKLMDSNPEEQSAHIVSSMKDDILVALKGLMWDDNYFALEGKIHRYLEENTKIWGVRISRCMIDDIKLPENFLARLQRLKKAELDSLERQYEADLQRIDAVEKTKTDIMIAELKSKAQQGGIVLTKEVENNFLEEMKDLLSQAARTTVVNQIRVEASAVADSNNQNINISNSQVGDINQVAADTIQNAFNKVTQSSADPNLKTELEKLNKAVAEMIKQLPEERQREVAQDLKTLTDEATSESPRRKWYELSAEGLLEAAKAVGETATPVIKAVQAVLPLIAAV